MANILIVDDDPAIIELMTVMLGDAGHSISKCLSGLAALKQLGLNPENPKAEAPDLIILDIMMPGADGYTIATMIRGCERTRNIPILVASSVAELSPLFKTTVRIEGFMGKPFTEEDLLGKVKEILSYSKPADKN